MLDRVLPFAAPESPAPDPVVVVGSRSHANPELLQYLGMLGDYELVNMGSSLKFCLLAEGKADFYPRLGPTSEWDTAAAHAVVKAAGGRVPIRLWTRGVPVEEGALVQLANLSKMPFVFRHVAAMPDVHEGLGSTIGCVFAAEKAVVPADARRTPE